MENKYRILLAEDDVNLGKVLCTYLSAKNFEVSHANNGEVAYEMFCSTNHFDICLIDVMMPIQDGFTLAKSIRKVDTNIPIIFLTAKSQSDDIVEGLSIGDDYITKPFDWEVLLARIQAALRRAGKSEENVTTYQIGGITFDTTRQVLVRNGEEIKISTRETEVLTMLVQKKNEVLERGFALKKIWGDDSFYNARTMDVYITKLRKYFKDEPGVKIINVHGVGFKLVM
ncbi:MAG: response regulator transcription factor [Bacteroidales bacterium]|nr:response regulator transcription factor [Bacteroidales bacterium]